MQFYFDFLQGLDINKKIVITQYTSSWIRILILVFIQNYSYGFLKKINFDRW
jgi:hypothetical protein